MLIGSILVLIATIIPPIHIDPAFSRLLEDSCARKMGQVSSSFRVYVNLREGMITHTQSHKYIYIYDYIYMIYDIYIYIFIYLFPTTLCGVLVFDSVSRASSSFSSAPAPPPLCHTTTFTHHLSHTSLSTTISHTHLCPLPSLQHIFVHTHLCPLPSLTHIFVNHHLSHHLSHTSLSTIFVRLLSHTHLCQPPYFTPPSLSTGRRGTWRHPPPFPVAGVALGDSHLGFAWQAGSGGSGGWHHFVTHNIFYRQLCHTQHLSSSHTIFHIQLCHHNFVLLVGPPPHPLSFLLSPSPLQHLVLIIGRSCLVGLSGPLI